MNASKRVDMQNKWRCVFRELRWQKGEREVNSMFSYDTYELMARFLDLIDAAR